KAKVLQLLGRDAEGEAYVQATLELDPFAYASGLLLPDRKEVLTRMGDRVSSFLEAAQLFMLGGWYREAYELLDHCPAASGALAYYQAYCLKRLGEDPKKVLATASSLGWGAPFAHTLEDMLVLSDALLENPKDSEAAYQLGNLLYDKRRYEEAVEAWEQSRESNPKVPMVWRNLALAYFNKQGKAEKALEALTKAFSLDESDSRICMELDQLHKKVGRTPQQRLSFLSAHLDLVSQRDDLYTEYVALLNLTGACEQAYEMIMGHTFHPWEGGEGKITREYVLCMSNLAFQALQKRKAEKARFLLQKALVFPANLGEGKLEGQKDNDLYYLLGRAERMLGNEEQAVAYFTQAAIGSEEPANMMYYNDQPADMIYFQALARRALGDEQGAQRRLQCLVDYAQMHQDDHITIDYFAVSLPDLQIFEDDLDRSNQANCFYLLGLGWCGLGKQEEGRRALQKALALVPCHQGAGNRLGMLE
ncbi:MAG: tetratricopeptide repeat protein, partial [Sphaerochaeta sp.]